MQPDRYENARRYNADQAKGGDQESDEEGKRFHEGLLPANDLKLGGERSGADESVEAAVLLSTGEAQILEESR